MIKVLWLFFFILSLSVVKGAVFPAAVKFDAKGNLKIGDIQFHIDMRNRFWSGVKNKNFSVLKSVRRKDFFAIDAKFNHAGLSGDISEQFKAVGNDSFDLDCKVDFSPEVTLNGLFGTAFLPVGRGVVTIDGKKLELPENFKKPVLFNGKFKSIRMKLAGLELTVTGPTRLYIYDKRSYNQDYFALRFYFSSSSGKVKNSSLKLRFKIKTIKNQNIQLNTVANRGLAGKAVDLSGLPSGCMLVQGITFQVIDPTQNAGNTVVAVGDDKPHSFSLDIPDGVNAGALNLLHSLANPPAAGREAGEIRVKFRDGSSQTIPVVTERDCGNWKIGASFANAAVAWYTGSRTDQKGIYASSFKLDKRNPQTITFNLKSPDALWLIAGVNLSEKPVAFDEPQTREICITANKKWLPLKFRKHVLPGSPLDFSWTNDAPAGKYGFIRSAPNGDLTFEKAPDKRIRLYGVNLCMTACFLNKKQADILAENLVRCGYNAVRIHHHDTEMLDPRAKNSLTLDKKKLDRLDYLFYTMKKHGLYITTDFYVNRVFKPGDNIPECNFYKKRQMKMLLPLSAGAMANWKQFVRQWMTHKNPYTGMTWAEDPALFAVNLVNEDTLTNNWSKSPESTKLYRAAFKKWKKDRNISETGENDRMFQSFLYELQQKCCKEMLRFVKDELKMKTMFTSLNYLNDLPLTLLRDNFDLVDNHSYYDHPSLVTGKWKHPFRFSQQSAINRLGLVPTNIMPTRIFGKPFIVTEYNYCNPNIYRAEAGPMIGAYSSLQNWGALFRFAWAHHEREIVLKNRAVYSSFDTVNDPLAQLSDRIAIAMFVRGDVAVAKHKYSYQVAKDIFRNDAPVYFPIEFRSLGLIAGIGSNVAGTKLPAGVVPLDSAQAAAPALLKDKAIARLWQNVVKHNKAVSDTGQLQLDATNYTLAVKTPRLESLTLKKGSLKADFIRIKDADSFQTVAAIAIDGKVLRESKSILIIHLTNISNSQAVFKGYKKLVMEKPGKTPLLVYRGTANLKLNSGTKYKVTALSANGDKLGPVIGKSSDGTFSFKLDPGCYQDGVMAYLVTR